MNRRSFLQFIGLAPAAPTLLAALPPPVDPELYGIGPAVHGLPSMTLDAVCYEESATIPTDFVKALMATYFRDEWLADGLD